MTFFFTGMTYIVHSTVKVEQSDERRLVLGIPQLLHNVWGFGLIVTDNLVNRSSWKELVFRGNVPIGSCDLSLLFCQFSCPLLKEVRV